MKNYGVRITEGVVTSAEVTSSVSAVATSLESEVVIDLDQAQFLLFATAFLDSTGNFALEPGNCNPTVYLTWEDQRATQKVYYNQQVTGNIGSFRPAFGTSNRDVTTQLGTPCKLGSSGANVTSTTDFLTNVTEQAQSDPIIIIRRSTPCQFLCRMQGNVSGQPNGLASFPAGELQSDDGDTPYVPVDYYQLSTETNDYLPHLTMRCIPCKFFNYAQFSYTASPSYDTAIAYQLIF